MTRTPIRSLCAALCLALLVLPGLADDGHGHGETPAAATQAASPRTSAHSELFELVGIVDKGQMVVYLDRYASNEPVAGARIEVEAGTEKGVAAPQPDGTYLVRLAALDKPGALSFAFTVTAGADSDLLASELELKDPHAGHDGHAGETGRPWLRWTALAVAALVAAVLLAQRLRTRRRRGLMT